MIFNTMMSPDQEIDPIQICTDSLFVDFLQHRTIHDLMSRLSFYIDDIPYDQIDQHVRFVLHKKTIWKTKVPKEGDIFSLNIILPSGHWIQMGWLNVSWKDKRVKWEV